MAKITHLSLGTNKKQNNESLTKNLEKAIAFLLENSKIKLLKKSSLYCSEPFQMTSKNWFLNQVLQIETDFTSKKLLNFTQQIEKKLGRDKKSTSKIYEDRVIDIDILDFEDTILATKKLTIPHPELTKRLFVLLPLKEVNPNWIHPILKQNLNYFISKITNQKCFIYDEKA